jgi:hypothetical protein
MIETWFEHAHPGIYMRVTIFWAWVVLLLWMPIAIILVGASEGWEWAKRQMKQACVMQNRYWKKKHD